MRIISVIPIYNEITFLPIQVRHLENYGVEPYFLDNYSNDGSWEWLNDHQYPCIRFSTNESFNMTEIQKQRISIIHKLKPDWVIYGDCDELFVTSGGLRGIIEEADRSGFNMIRTRSFEFHNTGEIFESYNPLTQYYYGKYRYKSSDGLVRIHKYAVNIFYGADSVHLIKPCISNVTAINLNYGPTKPICQREEILSRKRKAWDAGLNRAIGQQYIEMEKQGWISKRNHCLDVRSEPYSSDYKALIKSITA
jgi:hypothetical protein